MRYFLFISHHTTIEQRLIVYSVPIMSVRHHFRKQYISTSSSAMSYDRETARRMLQYSNLMTGGVGLYCDVLVAIGLKKC